MKVMENWFVFKGVIVKVGAVCDHAFKAVTAMTNPLPKIPNNMSQCFLMVFMEFFILVLFDFKAN